MLHTIFSLAFLTILIESKPQKQPQQKKVMSATTTFYGALNFTTTEDLNSPLQILSDPDNLHEYQKTKLSENEIIRQQIYEKYFPFFILSGVSFIILSGVWILYNILSYTRKQNKIKKMERLNRQSESKRLLQLYHEIPVETIERS